MEIIKKFNLIIVNTLIILIILIDIHETVSASNYGNFPILIDQRKYYLKEFKKFKKLKKSALFKKN